MKPEVYLETTVISYYTAQLSRDIIIAAHQQVTREWWDTQLHQFTPFISEIVYEEISRGNQAAAQKRLEAVKGFDYLVSWNFAHIVGARPRKIIDEINYRLGIKSPI